MIRLNRFVKHTHLCSESYKTAHSSADVSLQQYEWWHEDNKTLTTIIKCVDKQTCERQRFFFLRSVRCSRKTIIRGRVSDYSKSDWGVILRKTTWCCRFREGRKSEPYGQRLRLTVSQISSHNLVYAAYYCLARLSPLHLLLSLIGPSHRRTRIMMPNRMYTFHLRVCWNTQLVYSW